MKKLIVIFTIIFSGIVFGQNSKAGFFGGEKQLKKLIYSKINFDSTDVDEDTIVRVIFKINKKGKVKNIDVECLSFYPKTKIEFLRAAKQIKQKWKPATENGKKVDAEVVVSFPVVFE